MISSSDNPNGCAAALLIVLSAIGCSNARVEHQPEPGNDAALRRLADRILQTEPHRWPEVGPIAIAAGPALAEPLGHALDATDGKNAPAGLQLALGLLGAIGDGSSAELLTLWITEDRPYSDEAALALGHLGTPLATDSTRRALTDAMHDNGRAVRTRVAAAAALLDCGSVATSLPMLHATLVAGTPFGRESSARLGLPSDKSRWALERRIVIDAVRRHTGGEDFGLDPECPWPDLARAAEACRDALSLDAAK